MPRSRRSQEVALTQTAKKTRDHKSSVIQDIRDAIDKHATLYLFSYENMRSQKFKKIRMDFRKTDDKGNSSRIFLGKNKLMQIALGRVLEDEYAENLKEVSKRISGSVGLLLTNRPHDEVETYFADLLEEDFARAGSISPRKVVLTAEMLSNFPPSMVEQFRGLGLPVDVKMGKLEFVGGMSEHTICKNKSVLSAENCKILCQFGIMLAEFKVNLVCRWESSNGSFEAFS